MKKNRTQILVTQHFFGEAEEEEKEELCDRLKDLAKRSFGCNRYHVCKEAFIFTEKRGLKHPRGNKKISSADWVTAFLKRNRAFPSKLQRGYQNRVQKE